MSYQFIFGFPLIHYLLCHTHVVFGFVCCTKVLRLILAICLFDMWHQVTLI
jgi:hypothetical protein